MRAKGRHWVLLWLVLFLGVAMVVVARGSAAYRLSRDLETLRSQRASLEARRAELMRRIHAASSRQTLGDRARRAGLRQPGESEYILFQPPARSPDASR